MAKKHKAGKTIKKSLLKRRVKVKKTDESAETVKKIRVRVIGIGGGGGSIVSALAQRVKKASFVVANTDYQALSAVNKSCLRFQFGEKFTRGLGTGMNPEIAREAAQSEKERIKKLFEGQDLCILVASLGGGCGSGAGPIFAKIAKNSGSITFGVFTLPFRFEGEKKLEIAKDSLQKLRFNLNAISILPNERIFQIINKDTPLKEALSIINKSLAESLEGLIEAIFQPGLINIDFADLKTILQGQGRFAYLNTVEAQKSNLETQVLQKVLNCQLYPYTIRGAKGVLFNIVGEKELSISDVSQISKTISGMVNPEAKIIFGISQNKKYQDKIKVSLLATGCQFKVFSDTRKKQRRVSRKKPPEAVLPQPKTALSQPKAKKGEIDKKPEMKPKKNKILKKKKKKKVILVRVKENKPQVITKEEKTEALTLTPEKGIEVGVVKEDKSSSSPFAAARVRKNALQIKKEVEEAEKELVEKEKVWETPAFLRQKYD